MSHLGEVLLEDLVIADDLDVEGVLLEEGLSFLESLLDVLHVGFFVLIAVLLKHMTSPSLYHLGEGVAQCAQ